MTNNLKEIEEILRAVARDASDSDFTIGRFISEQEGAKEIQALINQKEREKELEVLGHFEGLDQYYNDDGSYMPVKDRIKQLKEELKGGE